MRLYWPLMRTARSGPVTYRMMFFSPPVAKTGYSRAFTPHLTLQASAIGIDTTGSASAIALRLFEAGQQGMLDECTLFATMTWCYAGRTIQELTEYAAKVLLQKSLPKRLRAEMSEILQWARRRNVRCVVVSASPYPIVAGAAVIGGSPQTLSSGRCLGFGKVRLLTNCSIQFRSARTNACSSKGDSLATGSWLVLATANSILKVRCAEMAVAVSPKPSLYSSLLRLSHAVV